MGAAALIPIITGLVSGGLGLNSAMNADQLNQAMVALQQSIANQELTQNAQRFGMQMPAISNLMNFYSQYANNGNPLLPYIQTASAQNTANQYQNAIGQANEAIQGRGYGFPISGLQAGTTGDLLNQEAGTESSNFLQNLLANEALKFQAAQGLGSTSGLLSTTGISMPNAQLPQPYTPQAVGSFGNALSGLAGLFGGSPTTSGSPATLPIDTSGTSAVTGIIPAVAGIP